MCKKDKVQVYFPAPLTKNQAPPPAPGFSSDWYKTGFQ